MSRQTETAPSATNLVASSCSLSAHIPDSYPVMNYTSKYKYLAVTAVAQTTIRTSYMTSSVYFVQSHTARRHNGTSSPIVQNYSWNRHPNNTVAFLQKYAINVNAASKSPQARPWWALLISSYDRVLC